MSTYVYNNETGRLVATFALARDASIFVSALTPGQTFTNEAAPCGECQHAAHRCVCDPDEMENRLEHQHEEEELGPKCGHGRYLNSEGCHDCEDAEVFQERLDAYRNEY